MTTEQIPQAQQMHDSGISYSIIAAYFKTSTKTLRKYINGKLLTKYYDLLQKAELANDRREAIRCIRESTKLREMMSEYSGLR